jgi:nucleolar complex protein 3
VLFRAEFSCAILFIFYTVLSRYLPQTPHPQIEKDLAEGDAEIRDAQKQRVQRELLDLVFATYFRILKTNGVGASARTLPVVLRGLAKFAHLINIGLVVDTLECLRSLVADQGARLSLPSALHCIIAAFETLSGPGQTLTVEVTDFYTHLFNYLWALSVDSSARQVCVWHFRRALLIARFCAISYPP